MFTYSNDNERQYVRQIAKQALSKKVRIYILTDETRAPFGFIALSVGSIHGIPPCIIIDYLFTSQPFRSITFTDLKECKISHYLIGSALQIAQQVNNHVPICRSSVTV
jgi:hypothetical protein